MHQLYHFRLCPLSRSIRLAMIEHEIPCKYVEERAWEGRPEFLSINPAGELPVLILATGEVVSGAYAIVEYLAEAYPATHTGRPGIPLLPGDSIERAEVRRIVDWFHRKFHWEVSRELLMDKVYPIVSPVSTQYQPDATRLRAVRANLRYHMSYISYLADDRPWLAGESASFADIAAACHLSTVDYLGELDWEPYPAAKDWYARMKSRPSFRPLLHERIVGPEPPPHYAELDF